MSTSRMYCRFFGSVRQSAVSEVLFRPGTAYVRRSIYNLDDCLKPVALWLSEGITTWIFMASARAWRLGMGGSGDHRLAAHLPGTSSSTAEVDDSTSAAPRSRRETTARSVHVQFKISFVSDRCCSRADPLTS